MEEEQPEVVLSMFETEVNDLLRKKNIQKVLEVKNGQHPILLKEFMAKKVSLETICIMDEIIGFTKDWDKTHYRTNRLSRDSYQNKQI